MRRKLCGSARYWFSEPAGSPPSNSGTQDQRANALAQADVFPSCAERMARDVRDPIGLSGRDRTARRRRFVRRQQSDLAEFFAVIGRQSVHRGEFQPGLVGRKQCDGAEGRPHGAAGLFERHVQHLAQFQRRQHGRRDIGHHRQFLDALSQVPGWHSRSWLVSRISRIGTRIRTWLRRNSWRVRSRWLSKTRATERADPSPQSS